MPTEYQLRDYRVKPGEMDAWIKEWRTKVYPLRVKFGFRVIGAWKIGKDRFVWILGWDGLLESFEEANRAYYASPERRSLDPDPARHPSRTEEYPMTSVIPSAASLR